MRVLNLMQSSRHRMCQIVAANDFAHVVRIVEDGHLLHALGKEFWRVAGETLQDGVKGGFDQLGVVTAGCYDRPIEQ
jgi:hypothetical protein